jgi:hypothetical protein
LPATTGVSASSLLSSSSGEAGTWAPAVGALFAHLWLVAQAAGGLTPVPVHS